MKRFLSILLFLIPAISSAQLEGLVIVIDPGHGGYESDDRHLIPDPGVDFWESVSNYYKARHLQKLLGAYVDTVILTREENSDTVGDPSLTQRWTLANTVGADWFHSVHSNASGSSPNLTINRTMVLLKENINTRQPAFPEAVVMSSNVYNQIRAHLRTASTAGNISGYPGVYLDYTFYGGYPNGYNLGVLSGLTMPGELSEGSFHDFFPETRRLMNNDYRKFETYALMKAFLQYFGAPADTFGIIAGIQTNAETGAPMNGTVVRILPGNRIYTGDTYNNGFYMFDSLSTGPHTIIFDTPYFAADSVEVTVSSGGIHFVDRVLSPVLQASPIAFGQIKKGDTASVSLIIHNRGGWEISIGSITNSKAEFWTTSPLPDTIAAGDSTSVNVFFSPASFGSFSDTIVLTSDSGTIVAPVSVTGSSLAPSILLSHSFMGFGTVTTDTSKVRPMYLSSPSVNGVQIDSIYTKTAAFQFSPPQSFPFGLELGDTVFLSITFAPQGVGIASDTLFIANSSAVNPVKVSLSGNGVINSVEKLPGTVDHFALFQNYPNPFNPVTAISYQIPAKAGTVVSYVRLSVVDMLGREVAVLVNEEQEAGRYSVTWEASSVPSGVYFYTLTTPHYRASRKMVLVK